MPRVIARSIEIVVGCLAIAAGLVSFLGSQTGMIILTHLVGYEYALGAGAVYRGSDGSVSLTNPVGMMAWMLPPLSLSASFLALGCLALIGVRHAGAAAPKPAPGLLPFWIHRAWVAAFALAFNGVYLWLVIIGADRGGGILWLFPLLVAFSISLAGLVADAACRRFPRLARLFDQRRPVKAEISDLEWGDS